MIKVLVDTNVLLDFFNHRKFYDDAASILDLAMDREFKAYASAHEITTLAYYLEKDERSPGEARQKLSVLFRMIQVLPVDQEILQTALRSRITDFEDAVLEAVSLKHGVEFIVTRDKKDFSHSKVQALSPSLFLKQIQKTDPNTDFVMEPKPSYKTRSTPKRKKR